MVPPEAFSTAAAQSSSAFCRGCEAGTQCEIFSSKVFSCAEAGAAQTANSTASSAFFILSSPGGGRLVQPVLLLNMLYSGGFRFKLRSVGFKGPHHIYRRACI